MVKTMVRNSVTCLVAAAVLMATHPHVNAGEVARVPIHRAASRAQRPGGLGMSTMSGTMGAVTYHNGATLNCADCHTMHASQQHNMDGSTGGSPWSTPFTIGPYKKLLKAPSTTELCLACHDGQTFAPDVVDADANGLTERAAGLFGQLDAPNFKGHNLSRSPDAGGGGLCGRCHFGSGTMATASVQCVDCHAYHGNGNYRNVQWASDPGGEGDIRAIMRPGSTGLSKYEAANIGYTAPAGSGGFAEVTNVCIDCHHTFMDDSTHYYTKPGGMDHWGRHAGTNSEWDAHAPIDAAGANTDPAHWVDGTGMGFSRPRLPFVVAGATDFTTATTVAATNEVFCLTCHKAHGSENPFSLRWDFAQNKDTCYQCHNNVLTE